MTDRADYIRGLRTLADMLTEHDDVTLPHDGTTGALPVFPKGENARAHAIAYARLMAPQPTMEVRPSGDIVWVDIVGQIHGLRVQVHLRANQVCERRVTDVYRASGGSVHEVAEWVIPAELLEAAGGGDCG